MTTDSSVCMLCIWPGHVRIWCPMCAWSLVSRISAPVLSNRWWLGPDWSLPLTHQARPVSSQIHHPSKTSMKLSDILSVLGQIYCRKSRVPSLFSNLSELYMTEFSPQSHSTILLNIKNKHEEEKLWNWNVFISLFHEQTQTSEPFVKRVIWFETAQIIKVSRPTFHA